MNVVNPELAFRWGLDEDGYVEIGDSTEWAGQGPIVPAGQVEQLSDTVWSDPKARALEWEWCRRQMWHWMTTWCWTYDNSDPKRYVKRFPRYRFLQEVTEHHAKRLAAEHNPYPHLIIVKPRAILWSTWCALKNLHGLMFVPRWSGYMMSLKFKRVDDGGHQSSPNSLFGKIRFSYNFLPEWMRAVAPLTFNLGVIRNPKTGAILHAEVAGEGSQAGLQVMEGDVDEAGLLANLEEILAVAEPGARFLTVGGTPRAAGSGFHTKALNSPEHTTYDKFEFDWWLVPLRRRCKTCGSEKLIDPYWMLDPDTGIEHPAMTEHLSDVCRPQDGLWEDKQQDRFRSPWFDHATRSMSEDLKRREFERVFYKASVGQVFRILRRQKHLVDLSDVPEVQNMPRYEFWDHGINDATAIWHIAYDGTIAYFIEYFEASNETAAWYCRRKAWLHGEYHVWRGSVELCLLKPDVAALYANLWGEPGRHRGFDVHFEGDSAGANRESDGLSWHRRFEEGHGFATIEGERLVVGKIPMAKAPKPLIEDRIETCKWAIEDGRVLFVRNPALVDSHSDAERGYNRVEAYHRPIDRNTGEVKMVKPVHDASSHAADPFGYALVRFFGVRHHFVLGAGGGALTGD